ncbi:MAG: helix-turn-helix domain-containing protein [Flavobacteriaceae bacterium]
MSIYDYVSAEFGHRANMNVDRFTRRAAAHLARQGRGFVDDPDNPDPAALRRWKGAIGAREKAAEKARARQSRMRALFAEAHEVLDHAMRGETPPPRPRDAREAEMARDLARIRDEICAAHGIEPGDLTGHRRARGLTIARQECMWRMRKETEASLPQIGRALGGRDHTTVLYGLKCHAERISGGKKGGAA